MKAMTQTLQTTVSLPVSDRGSRHGGLSDEDLMGRYQSSADRELFAELVYRYERELFAFLSRYLGDRQLAEDAFQATFLQVHLKCDSFESGRKFRPWLYSIATRKAIDLRRRNKRHRMASLDGSSRQPTDDVSQLVDSLESDDRTPVERVLGAERTAIVRETLERLPESLTTILHLIYYQGLKYREAADVLNVPVGTVKSRLHCAINRLSEIWENLDQVEPS
jgi:RNA polymerase sigma-70 factor (ECF subfamily)